MKNKFLEPSIEVLKFHCADEGSADWTTDKDGSSSEADGDNIIF
jgi:hypothetical protein